MGSDIGVSAVVLTKNEENNLRYCLHSLEWCDEIIVVDSDSNDSTLDIARAEGAKVIQENSAEGRFDHLRNFGIKKATNDWIFVLDADEICPKELAVTLLEEAEKEEFDAFNIPRQNYMLDEVKISSIYPDYQTRFHKKSAVDYGEELHKFLDVVNGAEIKDFDPEEVEPILHFSVQSVRDQFDTINRYSSIRAQNESSNYNIFTVFFAAFWDMIYTTGRNFIYKKGYKKPHQTALTVFTSFVAPFMLYFKKWQIREKGTEEEVLDKINDIREEEVRKYDEVGLR